MPVSFRKTPINMQGRVVQRLVFERRMPRRVVAEMLGLSVWRIGQLVKPWCVIFGQRRSFQSSYLMARPTPLPV